MIGDMPAFLAELARVEAARENRINMMLTPKFSSQMTNAQIDEALVTGLPMAQGIQRQIVRNRGRGMIVSVKVRYRDGVRMAAFALEGRGELSAAESTALELTKEITTQAMMLPDEQARCAALYGWVCAHIRYVHTAPGQKGYEHLVSAAGALSQGQANCQGFADVMYLLCRLCGIEAQYRCGWGEKRLHVWNEACINGTWTTLDASKGARCANWQAERSQG